MAGMVPSQHSFNHYIWELEQVGNLDRQYWQTVTSVIPTGEERLLFNKTVEYNKGEAMNRSKSWELLWCPQNYAEGRFFLWLSSWINKIRVFIKENHSKVMKPKWCSPSSMSVDVASHRTPMLVCERSYGVIITLHLQTGLLNTAIMGNIWRLQERTLEPPPAL